MSTQKNQFTGDKVPGLTKAIYPWSGIFRDACYALVGTFLLQYAMTSGVLSTDYETYKAQMHIITIAMMIALVWDGINDPIMGFLVEKFHFKAGKYKPWILIGAIGNAIAVALMFLVRPGGDGWLFVALMLVFYFLWDLFFTMNDIGYWSMLPSLTNDPDERAKLTTNVTIATTIGAFVMNMMMFLLPTMIGAQLAYGSCAVVIAILFLASQAAIYFFCKEKQRDEKQEEVSEKTGLLDLFKIVGRNKQLLVIVIVMFLYYIGSGLLTGIGLNYYYLLYGYNGAASMMATMMSVVYVLGTLLAQVFYPMMVKKMSKMKIITICFFVIMAAYLLFFFLGFPVFSENPIATNAVPTGDAAKDLMAQIGFAVGGTHFLVYLCCFFFFAATGIFYLALLVMFQDAIDYQEWKFGERKEAIAFAWRPLDVKLGSAVQTGIRNLTFMITGTQVILNGISTAEGHRIYDPSTGEYIYKGTSESFDKEIDDLYKVFNPTKRDSLVLFGVIIIGIIIVVFTACFLLLKFGYKITEEKEAQIVADLKKVHEKDAELIAEGVSVDQIPETKSEDDIVA